MTTAAVGKLLDSCLTKVEGQPGFWQGLRDGVSVFVFSSFPPEGAEGEESSQGETEDS